MGKIKGKEVRLLLHATNHHHCLTKIRLGMACCMGKRNKHLSTAPAMFTDIILDRRVAALEAVLVPQTLKNTLGGMSLLAVPVEVFQQPLIDEAGEAVQLRPFDLRRAPIARRH